MALIVQKIKVPEMHWERLDELQKITEISPGTSLKNARLTARKGQPEVHV
jgi:hypothetical protein